MAFTLAHLSDPHLAPLPQPRWSDLIGKRLTGYLNWRRKRRFIHVRAVLDRLTADLKSQSADHIAVSGDLANIALPEEFTRGRDWLETLGSPADVTVIPGNHDIYVPGAAALAARAWEAQMRGDERSAFPFVRRRGPLALIGLCSGVPTAPFMATGRLGAAQLGALAAALDALKAAQAFRVVMLHHPPVSAAGWHKRLTDAADFMRVIATHGAELIIHGHDHLHMLNWLDGPGGTRVPAVGVPSASAAPGMSKDAAAYNLYAIDGAPGAWHCEMISRGVDGSGDVGELRRTVLVAAQ
jgi:3',5'-cyclic AMP phosphodiesterase CpdA